MNKVIRCIAALGILVGGTALLTYLVRLGNIFIGKSLPDALGWSRSDLALLVPEIVGFLAAVVALIAIVVMAGKVAFPDPKMEKVSQP